MVLDASALLALINAEPGGDVVAAALPEASISVINLTEVVTKMIDIGISRRDAWTEAADLVPVIVDFDVELGRRVAGLREIDALARPILGRSCLFWLSPSTCTCRR